MSTLLPEMLLPPRLAGDVRLDIKLILDKVSELFDVNGIRWCVVGDLLLHHYGVPKLLNVRRHRVSFNLDLYLPQLGLGILRRS